MKVFNIYSHQSEVCDEAYYEEEIDDSIIQQFTYEDIVKDFKKLIADGFYQA